MWLSCLFTILPGPVNTLAPGSSRAAQRHPFDAVLPADSPIEGDARHAVSPNFAVTSAALDARRVAALAEERLTAIRDLWAEDEDRADWSPRCELVVHANRVAYAAAVGSGGEISLGSSNVKTQEQKITARRIDLVADGQQLPALAHELTHLVLADAFNGRRPPPWADEGMAILADDLAKRQLHQRDFRRACFRRAIWPLQTLLARETYPPTSGFPTFYAQGASLTAFLVSRSSPSQFVRFIKQAAYCGYDRALRDSYAIEGIGELEKLWRYDIAHNARLEDGICQGK